MEYVPCIGNSSYSFWRILLKLYKCFKDGLKICILFFQNPEIIFYHFLRIFNLDIFRALILQICIWSMYLVSATPPTVFGESFWNFTDVLRMIWRYAYCFFRILKLFFLPIFFKCVIDIGIGGEWYGIASGIISFRNNRPLIYVQNAFLVNILRMNRRISIKYCICIA